MYIINTPKSLHFDIRTVNSSPQLRIPYSASQSLRSSPFGSTFKSTLSSKKFNPLPRLASKSLRRSLNLKLSIDTPNTLKTKSYILNSPYNRSLNPSQLSNFRPKTELAECSNKLKVEKSTQSDKKYTDMIKTSSSTFKFTQISDVKLTSPDIQNERVRPVEHFAQDLSRGFALFHHLHSINTSKPLQNAKESIPKLKGPKSRIRLPSAIPQSVSSVHRSSKVLKSFLKTIDILDCNTPSINHSQDELNDSFTRKADYEKSAHKSDIETFHL